MGSAHSKSPRTFHSSSSHLSEKSRYQHSKLGLESRVSELALDDAGEPFEPSFSLNISAVYRWQDKLLQDPKNRLALAALSSNPAAAVLQNQSALLRDEHMFSDKIELEGAPITNQRSSGRCWLFASTNVFRVGLMKKRNLAAFEYSQSYLFFWDKLEKANFFLEQIIDTAAEPLDGRLVQTLMDSPVGDGGQWDMVVNIIEKYGLVPQVLYPDSYNAKNSSKLNWLLTARLREGALVLREIAASCADYQARTDKIQKYKASVLKEIHGALVLAMGAPPSPKDSFVWNYVDKDQKFHSLTTTPIDFYKDNVHSTMCYGMGVPFGNINGAGERFSLINDPRNEYMRHLTVERLGNVVGGRPITYVNVPMDIMKTACIGMIKANRPVFFGCDVGKFSDSAKGIMDTDLYDYELGFNVALKMDKAQRLMTGESAMTHAMVLTGVHLVDGKPVKWRVENSWSATVGEKGYFVMSDAWMDEYCYQAVTDPAFVSKEVLEVLKQDPQTLPLWDPMGSLA